MEAAVVSQSGDGKVVRCAAGNGACHGEFASDEARVSELRGRRESEAAVILRERRDAAAETAQLILRAPTICM